jgi:excisionase family DNA binding protein
MIASESDERLLTVDEAAALLGQKPRALRTQWRSWGLKGYRIGRSLRFRRSEVLAWLESRRA